MKHRRGWIRGLHRRRSTSGRRRESGCRPRGNPIWSDWVSLTRALDAHRRDLHFSDKRGNDTRGTNVRAGGERPLPAEEENSPSAEWRRTIPSLVQLSVSSSSGMVSPKVNSSLVIPFAMKQSAMLGGRGRGSGRGYENHLRTQKAVTRGRMTCLSVSGHSHSES